MRTERQHNLDRAVCLALSRMGEEDQRAAVAVG